MQSLPGLLFDVTFDAVVVVVVVLFALELMLLLLTVDNEEEDEEVVEEEWVMTAADDGGESDGESCTMTPPLVLFVLPADMTLVDIWTRMLCVETSFLFVWWVLVVFVTTSACHWIEGSFDG